MQRQEDLNALTIEELLQRLRRKGVPLQFEIGAFVALETCESIIDRPVQISRESVRVNEQGQVAVAAEGPLIVSEQQAVRSLLDLLSDLLLASAPGVPEDLLRLVDPGPEASDWTLKWLRDELEASLVPLNRQATRRVLARLIREAMLQKDRPSAAPPGKISQSELDASFDNLMGYQPADSGKASSRERASDAAARDSAPPASRRSGTPGPIMEPEEEDAALPVPEHHRKSMEQFVESDTPPNPFRFAVLAAVALLVALALGYSLLSYSRSGSLGCDRPDPNAEPTEGRTDPAPSDSPSPAMRKDGKPLARTVRAGRLTVNSSPQGAQVLLFAGTAPLTIEGLPLNVAHEFVAVGESRKPARALLPADAAWQDAPGGPRYELLLKSGDVAQPGGEWKLGPTGLPGDPGSPSGKLGTVRVKTDPAGMQVYRLIGFTPHLKIDNLPVDATAQLVLYESGYSAARVAVEPESWVTSGDGLKAEIDIALKKE